MKVGGRRGEKEEGDYYMGGPSLLDGLTMRRRPERGRRLREAEM